MAHLAHPEYRHDPIVLYAEERGQPIVRGYILAETCVVSKAWLDSLHQKTLAEARAAAEEVLKQRKASKAAAGTPGEGDHTKHEPGSWQQSLQHGNTADFVLE